MGKERIVDYRSAVRGWGHDINIIGEKWLGHGPLGGARIAAGDLLRVDMQSGREGLFRVETVSYFRDPPDMWSARVVFDRYEEGLDGQGV